MQGFANCLHCLVAFLCGDGSKLQEKGVFFSPRDLTYCWGSSLPLFREWFCSHCYTRLRTPDPERGINGFFLRKYCLASFACCCAVIHAAVTFLPLLTTRNGAFRLLFYSTYLPWQFTKFLNLEVSITFTFHSSLSGATFTDAASLPLITHTLPASPTGRNGPVQEYCKLGVWHVMTGPMQSPAGIILLSGLQPQLK